MTPVKRSNKIYVYITVLSAIIVVIYSFRKGLVSSWNGQSFNGSISLGFSDFTDIISRTVSLSCILFFLWNKLLWKLPLFRYFSNFPDISGRWHGKYERTSPGNDGQEHEYVIEIQQTFNNINCYTYQDTNSSHAILADLLHDGNNEQFQLVFHWGGARTTNERNPNLRGEYHGITELDFIPKNGRDPAKLHGGYFTNQGTYGDVEVKFESKKRKKGL